MSKLVPVKEKEMSIECVVTKGIIEYVVIKGIRLLDLNNPAWRNKIDLPAFNMGDPHHCVLAQLFTTYWTGLKTLNIDYEELDYFYGFDVETDGTTPGMIRAYDNLTKVWLRLAFNLPKEADIVDKVDVYLL